MNTLGLFVLPLAAASALLGAGCSPGISIATDFEGASLGKVEQVSSSSAASRGP